MNNPEPSAIRLKINDPVYGTSEISQPVLLELIEAPAVQRLKHINQYGPPPQWYESRFGNFSRYEHSVGTMLLLERLGASVAEQAAGLLHDVAHTAFSHVGDWVFGGASMEEYGDSFHNRFIINSELPEILGRHGLSTKPALDIKSFPLLEQPAPALCADRLDYALREAIQWANPELPPKTLAALTIFQGKVAMSDLKTAAELANTFIFIQEEHWASAGATLRYDLLARALKLSLDKGLLRRKDLYQDDDYLADKLGKITDPSIQMILGWLAGALPYKVTTSDKFDYQLKKKFRYIDPPVVSKNEAHLLSELNPAYKRRLNSARRRNQRGIRIKFLDPKLAKVLV